MALMACSTAPVGTSTASPPTSATALAPQTAYERKLQEQAAVALRQKHLADAAIAVELLTVLRPDSPDYRVQLADLARQIDAGVAARLPSAAQAAQRGDLDGATQLYLSVLALQPLNGTAADALRALERERNKRIYLGKFSRTTLTRRANAEAEMTADTGLAERNDLEHAALLAGDGEYDAAIALLEQRLAMDRQDLSTRRLLADVYYRQADAFLPRDRPAALAALDKSMRTYPAEPRAANRLKQLRQPERRTTLPASTAGSAVGSASASAAAPRATPLSAVSTAAP